jgi:FSR family fosmidomycin resistance protein-like MFS transporter
MSTASQAIRPASGRLIGLVSAAHFFSHFFILLLPPLFPLMTEAYSVGFMELGFAYAVFSVVTTLTQAPMGFVVDRYGARGLLIAGLVLESLAIGLIGVFPSYPALLVLMAVAGLANAVFHPADYALLSAGVESTRMGRAFSFHTASGYLGEAVAPVTIVTLLAAVGMRGGLLVCGAAGLLTALWLLANRATLDATDRAHHASRSETASAASARTGLRLLFSLPMIMALIFFMGIALSMRGVTSFSVSALHLLYDTPLALGSTILSAYLFASPVGVLLGGWLADRTRRHDLVAATCFLSIAAAIYAVAAVELPLAAIGVLFAVAGLASGVVAPSRDMMIRKLTPPGESGKVFGFVTSGYNIAGMVGPPAFGYLLDTADPRLIFWAVVALSLATLCAALVTGAQKTQ